MESQAKVFGHPIHQTLIPLPLGLLTGSVAFDVIHRATGDEAWGEAATATMGAGLACGLVAAPFGLIDWLAIPGDTRAKRIGAIHGLGNLTALGLYGASWVMRREQPGRTDTAPFALALAGLAVSGMAGWLGGELVDRLGVGVDPGAHLNAPSSLSSMPIMAPPSPDTVAAHPPIRLIEEPAPVVPAAP